ATDRLERLVADLLELTRLEAGRLRLEPAPHDLRALVLRTAGVVEALAQTRGQQLEVIVPPEPVVVEVDAPRLERVLLNLLSNAHTYGREGGAILVRLVPGPEAVEVAVADDGPGIPPDEHGRIFERFYRVQGSPAAAGQRRAPASGSGLGLAIARAFVELHGGRLWVESTPGQGATFRLTVPNRPS
ncbi:MAG: HAMP domain-containing histidine kinase, partial [Chloroflexi bacterium]|nr:HAMP domain-containing histidine kinase [Chloroflexota bacterium]